MEGKIEIRFFFFFFNTLSIVRRFIYLTKNCGKYLFVIF